MKEQSLRSIPGIPTLLVLLLVLAGAVALFIHGAGQDKIGLIITALVLGVVCLFAMAGFYMVEPNQAAVQSLFGKYIGTVKEQGLRWNNPFFSAKKISLRVRNFESGKLKVNDLDGSPIEIGAVIVWQVVDSAEAVYNVDDYESFVHIQSEAALRAMATSYPYDQHEDGKISLRSHAAEIAKHLTEEIQERASVTSPTPRKSPRRCCSASRPAPSSPPAPASSKARSAWWKWRSSSFRPARSWTWTRSGAR